MLDKLQFLDTHTHLNLRQFDDDAEEVLIKMSELSVGAFNVGTCQSTSERAVALAHSYPEQLRAIVGLHPLNIFSDPDDPLPPEPELAYEWYLDLARDELVVGIGECGFDYFHYPDTTYETQRAVFLAQIALAEEVQKPLMLHLRNGKDSSGRNAYDDALEILRAEKTAGRLSVAGNAHFFAGTLAQAEAFIALDFTVSFTGVITFAAEYAKLIKDLPLDKIHAETDAPYVAPKPYRGQRCEPWMVIEVYKKIAEIKSLPLETVQETLLANAQRLYRLD